MLPYTDANYNFSSCRFDVSHQPPQYQYQWQRYLHASNTLNSNTLVTLLEKQEHETNQILRIQVKIHIYHDLGLGFTLENNLYKTIFFIQ